ADDADRDRPRAARHLNVCGLFEEDGSREDSLAFSARLARDGGGKGGDGRLGGDERFELGVEGSSLVDVAMLDVGRDQGHALQSIAVLEDDPHDVAVANRETEALVQTMRGLSGFA